MGDRTQRELAYYRTCSKGDKIRKRLRWEQGMLNGDGDKPKGMHWRSFERLHAAHEAHVNQSLVELWRKPNLKVTKHR